MLALRSIHASFWGVANWMPLVKAFWISSGEERKGALYWRGSFEALRAIQGMKTFKRGSFVRRAVTTLTTTGHLTIGRLITGLLIMIPRRRRMLIWPFAGDAIASEEDVKEGAQRNASGEMQDCKMMKALLQPIVIMMVWIFNNKAFLKMYSIDIFLALISHFICLLGGKGALY